MGGRTSGNRTGRAPAAVVVLSRQGLSRRKGANALMLARFLPMKIGAVAIALLGGTAAAAAATSGSPGHNGHPSSGSTAGPVTSHHDRSDAHSPTAPTSPTSRAGHSVSASSSLPETGPANAHAQFGLCTAFLAGNESNNSPPSTSPPPQDSSTAFRVLIAQHGSIAATLAYCQGVVRAGAPSGGTGEAKHDNRAPAPVAAPGNQGKPPGVPGNQGKPAGGLAHDQERARQ